MVGIYLFGYASGARQTDLNVFLSCLTGARQTRRHRLHGAHAVSGPRWLVQLFAAVLHAARCPDTRRLFSKRRHQLSPRAAAQGEMSPEHESGILDFVNAMLSNHGRPATLGNEQNVVALKELDES